MIPSKTGWGWVGFPYLLNGSGFSPIWPSMCGGQLLLPKPKLVKGIPVPPCPPPSSRPERGHTQPCPVCPSPLPPDMTVLNLTVKGQWSWMESQASWSGRLAIFSPLQPLGLGGWASHFLFPLRPGRLAYLLSYPLGGLCSVLTGCFSVCALSYLPCFLKHSTTYFTIPVGTEGKPTGDCMLRVRLSVDLMSELNVTDWLFAPTALDPRPPFWCHPCQLAFVSDLPSFQVCWRLKSALHCLLCQSGLFLFNVYVTVKRVEKWKKVL